MIAWFRKRININPLLLGALLVALAYGAVTTGDLALYQPADNETGWGTNVNTNFQSLDTEATNLRKGILKTEAAFADADTTPSVSAGGLFRTANTGATSISNFDDPTSGQVIQVRVNDANTTFVHGATTIRMKAGHNVVATTGDIFLFRYDGTDWFQLAGGYGRGAAGAYVTLAEPDAIGDLIAVTQTTFTDIDVSDDGVPKGATAAMTRFYLNAPTSGVNLLVRKNGSASSTNNHIALFCASGSNATVSEVAVPLDADAKFEAKFDSSAGAASIWTAAVIGYLQ